MHRVVIELTGEIDLSNAWTISGRVVHAIDTGRPDRIVVDLADVTFIDCAGVRALLEAQGLAEGSGCTLIVSNPTLLTRQILRVLGVAERLLGGWHRARHLRKRPTWQQTSRPTT